MFHPINDCEQPLLYLPVPGIVSQETAISGSFEGSMPQYRVMPGSGSRSGWVCKQGEGIVDKGSGFSEGKPGKGIMFEM